HRLQRLLERLVRAVLPGDAEAVRVGDLEVLREHLRLRVEGGGRHGCGSDYFRPSRSFVSPSRVTLTCASSLTKSARATSQRPMHSTSETVKRPSAPVSPAERPVFSFRHFVRSPAPRSQQDNVRHT